jgi:hypothetical protein
MNFVMTPNYCSTVMPMFIHMATVGLIALVSLSSISSAQELEPRTYANTPTGINLLALGVVHSQGNVLLDPSLPIEGLDGRLTIGLLRYTRTFGLLNRSAKFKLLLPYSTGDWDGTFEGEQRTRDASGFGDARLDLAWNFYGAPALKSSEMPAYQQQTIVGAGIRIIAPTGKYSNDRLLNLGSNRWSIRSELGVSRAVSRWTFELIGSVWAFGDNNDFVNGATLEQLPLYVLKTHIVYTFRPGLWIGSGFGYGQGGRTSVDGVARNTTQQNWRVGMTLAYPINRKNGVSLALGSGANGGTGADFDSVALSYQYAWGDL